MGGRRYSLWVRRMAVEAWILAVKPNPISLKPTVALFKGMAKQDVRPSNLR